MEKDLSAGSGGKTFALGAKGERPAGIGKGKKSSTTCGDPFSCPRHDGVGLIGGETLPSPGALVATTRSQARRRDIEPVPPGTADAESGGVTGVAEATDAAATDAAATDAARATEADAPDATDAQQESTGAPGLPATELAKILELHRRLGHPTTIRSDLYDMGPDLIADRRRSRPTRISCGMPG